MFKMFKAYRLLTIFCSIFFFCNLAYGQRATTVTERDNDVKEINGLYDKGKWEDGKNKAEELLKKSPKDSDIRMMLGKYYLHKKQYDKARYELVKSLEYAPNNVDAKHMLVTVETETQRFSSAICYINELLEVNPYWKGLWRQKIELYRTMGNNVEADRLLKRISQIYPEDNTLKQDNSYALEQKEEALKKSGKLDESIEFSRKRVEEQPRQLESYFSVIDGYIKGGDYNNALVYTERGLNAFPGNSSFLKKKIAILEYQRRYPEIVALMEAQMKTSGDLRSQYNYFLLEAARSAKNQTAASLYAKIFDSTPANKEAFDFVFQDLIAKEQYEEAVSLINRHRRAVVGGKDLDMKELMAYKRMGNQSKISSLTRSFFVKYPEDGDLRESYVKLTIDEAKANMQDGNITNAINNWKDVVQFGNDEAISIAQNGLYSTFVTAKRYHDAIIILDEMLVENPGDEDLLLKKADLYQKEGRDEYAISIYEQVLGTASEQDRNRLMSGYNDLVAARVKVLREKYQLEEARKLTDRWLTIDQRNQDALLYMINLCYQLKDKQSMLRYAQIAENMYGDDMSFKIKLAEAMNHNPEKRADSWAMLHEQVKLNPFHDPLVNTFSFTTEQYAGQLLKEKDFKVALGVLDTALVYKEDDKTLKYMKGIAFEGLKKYDSAYQYQKYFEPTIMEYEDFKHHLNFLASRTYKNSIGISHLRARYGDDYSISTISSAEFTHQNFKGSSYTGRLNYAGREEGKGIQGQIEWVSAWSDELSTRIDLALANKFFSRVSFNAAAVYEFKSPWEAEIGVGYRNFYTSQNLFNLNFGATRVFEDLRLSAKLSNFLLDSDGKLTYLYSVGGKAQYYLNNPKNYLLAVGSVGNSPDIEILDNQFYTSFNVFNAMVGAGVGRNLSKNIGASVLGTWYNFQSEKIANDILYRNFYNLYFQLNVSF